MEDTRRRRSGGLRKLITAVFAVAFVASIISTVTAFAAANLFKIQNAELSELSTTAEGSISSFDETNVVSNVTFHKLNDSAKYTITLKNTDANDHVIESITDDNESPYISYLYDQHANEQINAGENLVFEVTAKYTTAITDINQRAQATNVRFFIHFTDLEEEIPIVPNTGVNPNTGDYIHFSVLSLIISAAGLTIIGIIALKKHKKASKFIAAGIVTVAAIATTATVKAATVEINSFTINTSYALNDRLIVTYTDKNGGEQELIVNYGEPVNIPDQSKDGYTLTGWEDENGNPVDPTQPITEDIKIHPVYNTNPYTIHFDDNAPSGSTSQGSMSDITAYYDTPKTLPSNMFTVTGYAFDSWNTKADGTGTKIVNGAEVKNLATEGTVNLYAQWAVTPYTVVFHKNADDATGDMESQQITYNQLADLNELGYSRTGYNFANWATNADGSGDTFADKQRVINLDIDGTVDLYAQWAPKEYTISFNINTNDPEATGTMSDQTIVYGTQSILNELGFTRTGYAFDSWNTEADGSGTKYEDKQDVSNTISDTDIALYAQWAVTPYTIIFNKNSEDDDVVGTMNSQEIIYGVSEALNTNEYTRRYYRFKGWNTKADGTGAHYNDAQEVKNLAVDGEVNLYAEWEELISILHAGQAFANRIWQVNPNIKQLIPYEGIPNLEGLNAVNVAVSGLPTYIWTDENDIVYYWSEAKAKLNGNMNQSFCNMTTLEKVDFSGFDASMVTNWSVAFTNDSRLKEVIFGKIDFSNTTTMAGMFNGTAIESIDLSNVKTSTKLTSVSSMFANCTKLKNITIGTNFETSNVTSFSNMFYNTPLLETLDEENLKVTDKATNLSKMFQSSALPELNVDSWNTSNVTDMSYLFASTKFTEIDINHFNTSSVTDMSGLFQGSMLSTIDITNWDTSNVTGFGNMFKNVKVSSLDISNFDTSSATSFQDMFSNTSPLKTIYASESFDPKTLNMRTFEISGVKGGAGTTWAGSRMLAPYARIDDPDNGKPGYFSIKGARYIRYNGNGADNSEYETMTSHYLTNEGSLTANAFTRSGYTFAGWNTKADGSGTSYTDGQLMSDIVESKEPLTLYAQWQ
ncbi:InlB B-repeat-containing protein [Candidatus Saccharibacteria bacterium]|nr:InlB B-repeat-containing protein [Candidatus Saccharibacteria bacterium]